jgi:hypothetical protein
MHSSAAREERQVNWRKVFWIGVLVLILAYHFGEPYLEKLLGIDLPSISERGENRRPQDDQTAGRETQSAAEHDNAEQGEASRGEYEPPKIGSADVKPIPSETTSGFRVESIGTGRWVSPAGLIYGIGPGGESRLDHVLEHARDNANRPVHSVFTGDKNEILQLIDEAYVLSRQKSDRVDAVREGDRTRYTVKMNRAIGYEGGKSGKRDGFPPLDRLRLIIQNENEIVTAYPYR